LHWSRYWFGTALQLSTVRYRLQREGFALEQVLVWDRFTVKHGQIQTAEERLALEQVLVWDSFTVKHGQIQTAEGRFCTACTGF
jgi:hypothetical protein